MKNRVISIFVIAVFAFCISSCDKIDEKLFEDGVHTELAKIRNKQLSNIKYYISFNIPEETQNNITGHEIIEFDFNAVDDLPLIIDFRNPADFIKSVKIDGKPIKYTFQNEHIVIRSKYLNHKKNRIEIEFIAGNRALNRNDEYLYTLFVPDRACTAFPCFDQPSLKAKFQPEITVPKEWIAVSNASLIEKKSDQDKEIYIFDESEPISTYLFSFVAGKFDSISKTYEDRTLTMYHREDDEEKLKRNTEILFDLKYSSLKWLEEYTQIKYPFKKMDFIIIPSFQYSGMEHPGAVLYRDSKMFLDESATIRNELDRANLIAHETAHMWFGDLVTMEWFSEVWLKEVFANFMAGKIVNPQYPDINHDLNFLINHYPASYSIDRTKGANPIEQDLDNMKNAGTLYGSIIYHKAPIVMNQLEKITGAEKLQEGLQQYLSENIYENATWDDLIQILDVKTEFYLNSWSKSWVYEPGMPHYTMQKAYNENNQLTSLIIEQADPAEQGRMWSQDISIAAKFDREIKQYQVALTDTFNVVDLSDMQSNPGYIFPNSDGLGYGYFYLENESKDQILSTLGENQDPVTRCAMYISLWENMLNQNIKPTNLLDAYLHSLDFDQDPQNITLVLNYIQTLYWKFLTQKEKAIRTPLIEKKLWDKMKETHNASIKSSLFKAYYHILNTPDELEKLYQIWNKQLEIKGLKLSENDFTNIALDLCVKNHPKTSEIIKDQLDRINNEEKKNRFEFIQAAITNRKNFFESLKDEQNREKEPWVIDALYYLHHPLKAEESVQYIRPSLDILKELQRTGDIFFPKQWLDACFSGHSSIDAVTEVNVFLNENADYPINLKNKILQSTDMVFRASIIKKE